MEEMTTTPTTEHIHQLVTRHLVETETAIDEACAAGLGADLILPLKGARTMYRRWFAAAKCVTRPCHSGRFYHHPGAFTAMHRRTAN